MMNILEEVTSIFDIKVLYYILIVLLFIGTICLLNYNKLLKYTLITEVDMIIYYNNKYHNTDFLITTIKKDRKLIRSLKNNIFIFDNIKNSLSLKI